MELDAELSAMPRVLHGLTAAVALGRAFPAVSYTHLCDGTLKFTRGQKRKIHVIPAEQTA